MGTEAERQDTRKAMAYDLCTALKNKFIRNTLKPQPFLINRTKPHIMAVCRGLSTFTAYGLPICFIFCGYFVVPLFHSTTSYGTIPLSFEIYTCISLGVEYIFFGYCLLAKTFQ